MLLDIHYIRRTCVEKAEGQAGGTQGSHLRRRSCPTLHHQESRVMTSCFLRRSSVCYQKSSRLCLVAMHTLGGRTARLSSITFDAASRCQCPQASLDNVMVQGWAMEMQDKVCVRAAAV
jgi:hypothetical protein